MNKVWNAIRVKNYEKIAQEMPPLFHFIMVFIDKVVADVGTLRMTFSRRVTVVTTKQEKYSYTGRPLVGSQRAVF